MFFREELGRFGGMFICEVLFFLYFCNVKCRFDLFFYIREIEKYNLIIAFAICSKYQIETSELSITRKTDKYDACVDVGIVCFP